MPQPAAPSRRARVQRHPKRAAYDRDSIHAILDEALVCHVGFELDAQPYVIPTIHWRDGDDVLLHGAAASRMLRELGKGVPVCVAASLVDGLVLARSAFHHSMNYRSVVLFGHAMLLEEGGEKRRAIDLLVDKLALGRAAEVRPATDKELRATSVLRVVVEEASAKSRKGPPVDDEEDYALPVWAGVVPLELRSLEPVADPRCPPAARPPRA
jgi:uncharacterized protein